MEYPTQLDFLVELEALLDFLDSNPAAIITLLVMASKDLVQEML
jgi:hypothetical protein